MSPVVASTASLERVPVPDCADLKEPSVLRSGGDEAKLLTLGVVVVGLVHPANYNQNVSSETARTIRDGDPKTDTSTFTQLLNCWSPNLLRYHYQFISARLLLWMQTRKNVAGHFNF